MHNHLAAVTRIPKNKPTFIELSWTLDQALTFYIWTKVCFDRWSIRGESTCILSNFSILHIKVLKYNFWVNCHYTSNNEHPLITALIANEQMHKKSTPVVNRLTAMFHDNCKILKWSLSLILIRLFVENQLSPKYCLYNYIMILWTMEKAVKFLLPILIQYLI